MSNIYQSKTAGASPASAVPDEVLVSLGEVAELLTDEPWEPTTAEYVPGVSPPRAADVPEWPPGHDPTPPKPIS